MKEFDQESFEENVFEDVEFDFDVVEKLVNVYVDSEEVKGEKEDEF